MNAPTEPASSRDGPPSLRLRASRFTAVAPTSYRILSEFAHGGIGRILRAKDERLDRIVALKELLAGGSGGGNEERFVREALVTARLQHPSIVPVYEAGRWPSGEPFYAMKLVSGRSLASVIDETDTFERRLALLPHVLAVAEAMAYAHSERIVHRDLKPANVLIGEFGETVVIDWGLAKSLDDDAPEIPQELTSAAVAPSGVDSARLATDSASPSLTLAGSVMGTPAFMPPEQAAGGVVDERADVYALGAILYHLLAGMAPYEGATSTAILKRVIEEPPIALERLQKGVPEDLCAIVRKAMARDVEQRYRTAKEFKDDLRLFQTGQIVGAHRYSLPERVRRFVRRHKAAVSVAALASALFWIGATLAIRSIVEARRKAEAERDRAAMKQVEAEASQKQATERADDLTLVQARASLGRDPNASLAWLKSLSPSFQRWGAARMIAADAASRGIAVVFRGHTAGVSQVAFSPDGKAIASASDDRTVRLWDVATGQGKVLATLADEAWTVAFSPDGSLLASGSKDKMIHVWDLATGQERKLVGHESGVGQLEFSKDGRFLVSRGERERLRLWDVATGEGTALSALGGGSGFFLHSDAKTLAFADKDALVLYDLKARSRRALKLPGSAIRWVALSEDKKRAAVAVKEERSPRLFDVATGKVEALAAHDAPVQTVTFPPGLPGALLSCDAKGEVRLWDLSDKSYRKIGAHEGIVFRAAVAPDGKTISTVGGDRTVRLWNLESGEGQAFRGFEDSSYWSAFSPDGSMVAAAGLDGTVRVWKTARRASGIVWSAGGALQAGVFADGGERVVTVGPEGAVRLVTLPPQGDPGADLTPPAALVVSMPAAPGKGEGISSYTDARKNIRTIAISPDGGRVVMGQKDGTTRVMAASGGEPLVLRRHDGQVWQVEFSPDGRLVATGGEDGSVRVWDVNTGEGSVIHNHHGYTSLVGFTPDGERVVSGGKDGVTIVSDLRGGDRKELRGHDGPVLSFGMAPDGSSLITGGFDHTVRIWSLTGGQSKSHDAGGGGVNRVVITPDGAAFLTLDYEASVRMWDARTGERRGVLRGHTAPTSNVVVAPDGRRAATASADSTVRLWDLESGENRVLGAFAGVIHHVGFSADGSSVVAVSADGTVRRWSDELPYDPEGLRAWLRAATPETIDAHNAL